MRRRLKGPSASRGSDPSSRVDEQIEELKAKLKATMEERDLIMRLIAKSLTGELKVNRASKSRRKIQVDRDFLRRYLDLLERIRESDRASAETLAEVRLTRGRAREQYSVH